MTDITYTTRRARTAMLCSAALMAAIALGVAGCGSSGSSSSTGKGAGNGSGAGNGAGAGHGGGSASVQRVQGDKITVLNRRGAHRTVIVSSTTKITENGAAKTLAAIKPGEKIQATGTHPSTGVTDATSIRILP